MIVPERTLKNDVILLLLLFAGPRTKRGTSRIFPIRKRDLLFPFKRAEVNVVLEDRLPFFHLRHHVILVQRAHPLVEFYPGQDGEETPFVSGVRAVGLKGLLHVFVFLLCGGKKTKPRQD